MVVNKKTGAPQSTPQALNPEAVERGRMALMGEGPPQHRHRLGRHPHRLHSEVTANLNDEIGDCRMEVQMLMRVYMVERKASRTKRLELRANFSAELTSNCGQEEKADPCAHHVPVKLVLLPYEPTDFFAWQRRTAVDQHKMKANAQARQPPGARHGGDHQTGGRKNAVPMRLLDSLIDRRVEPEIVSANNQAPQLAISRLRRK
jgi:hypothetical protein